mmetsp:Transcript_150616/g.419851  ORF Transcript_150616/g.419851 Transcript_150616/m.419851 type:complete len:739 (+) Transcript_150616:79-2295(+)
MTAGQIAAAAAAAASEGGTAKAAFVIKELAKLTLQLSHEQLQVAAAQTTLEGLKLCEQYAQRCIRLLIDALRMPETRPELAADAAWTLHKLTQRCDVAREWMRDAEGLAAVRHALVTHSAHNDLVQCSVGIVYSLDGLRGIASLLTGCTGGDAMHLPDSVVAVIVWSVYDLMKQERGGTDAAVVLRLLVQLLSQRSHDLEVRCACCSALDVIVHEDARLGGLLLELGGAPLLLDTLRHARSLGSSGSDLACACVNTVASLAKGSAMQAELLRQHGVVEVLAHFSVQGSGGADEEAAVWALGHLAGISTVLQAMAHSPTSVGVIRGGLDVVAELACQASTPDEVAYLPQVLQALLVLLGEMISPSSGVKCRKKCVAAICSTVMGIAPHAEPGQVTTLDQAVMSLLEVQTRELSKDTDVEIAEMALESLGRLVLIKPAWHHFLRRCGAEKVFSQRIQSGHAHRRLLKYTFWAAAALSGLPFVCRELGLHLRSAETIDAAFCTIIDILDDDLEGDWVLKEAERCPEDAVPSVLKLIAEAMQGYLADALLQSRGCHCVGLLAPLAPAGPGHAEALEAVLAAARRHPRCAHVLRDACYACHAFLEEPVSGARSSEAVREAHEQVAQALRRGGADAIAAQALADHADTRNAELLEEAVIVLCSLSGVRAALRALTDAGPGPVRTIGVKALAEFGRHQPLLLRQCAGDIISAVTVMAGESIEDDALQQNSALLIGFCNPCSDTLS